MDRYVCMYVHNTYMYTLVMDDNIKVWIDGLLLIIQLVNEFTV